MKFWEYSQSLESLLQLHHLINYKVLSLVFISFVWNKSHYFKNRIVCWALYITDLSSTPIVCNWKCWDQSIKSLMVEQCFIQCITIPSPFNEYSPAIQHVSHEDFSKPKSSCRHILPLLCLIGLCGEFSYSHNPNPFSWMKIISIIFAFIHENGRKASTV